VLELVAAFIESTDKEVPYQFVARRPGDIASCYASADRAQQLLNWSAKLSIVDMCHDTWLWQNNNPNGYE
jgi:UDP-glucose 4-epimerase